nr:MAG TPA: hypothetical protein [Caudoviricetes sp.]
MIKLLRNNKRGIALVLSSTRVCLLIFSLYRILTKKSILPNYFV